MRLAFVTFRALPQLSDDDRLAVGELRQQGVSVESAVWDSPLVDWARYDGIVVRSTWDYHLRPDDFEGWLAHIDALGIPIWNPASLLRWNMDKRYLLDLQQQGVSVAPLRHYPQHARINLADEVQQAGFVRYVLKPTVSANANKTRVCEGPPDAAACELADDILRHSGLLIQPFFDALVTHGELSLLFFGGQFSHAVCKVPRPGDFRSQPSFGAHLSPLSPSLPLLAQAQKAIWAAPHGPSLAYARVDGFVQDGRFELVELELIEPFLFLRSAPSPQRAAQRFAQSIVAAVSAKK